jgi:hypothetical protein
MFRKCGELFTFVGMSLLAFLVLRMTIPAAWTLASFPLFGGLMLISCIMGTATVMLVWKTIGAIRRAKRGMGTGELLVCSTSLLIIATIEFLMFVCSPCYFCNVTRKADDQVRRNMQDLNLHLNRFAAQHNGCYPEKINNEFKACFTIGACQNKAPGIAPYYNPYSGEMSWPEIGTISDIGNARKAVWTRLTAGVVEYSPIKDSEGRVTNYAIRGGGAGNYALLADCLARKETLVYGKEN